MAAAASPREYLAFLNSAPAYLRDSARSVRDMFVLVVAIPNRSTTRADCSAGILKVASMLVNISATPPLPPRGILKIDASWAAGWTICLIIPTLLPAIAKNLSPEAISAAVKGVAALTSFANCIISIDSLRVAPAIFEVRKISLPIPAEYL